MINMDTATTTYNPENIISPDQALKTKIDSIPDKLGFKIGEVADYVGVKQYVLRYWETEFDILSPKKSDNGQRVYSKRDIETALIVQKLLHTDRFSIEGARAVFKRLKQQGKSYLEAQDTTEVLEEPAPVVPKVERDESRPSANQMQKALRQREKEVNQQWVSSIEYFLEEVSHAKKRLLKL